MRDQEPTVGHTHGDMEPREETGYPTVPCLTLGPSSCSWAWLSCTRGNFLLQGFFGNLEASLPYLEAVLGQQEGNRLFLEGS